MKKLLLLFTILVNAQSMAQDPAVFGTWDLYRIEIKFSSGVMISDIDPPISPTLTISENLEFEGFGACNTFSGSFIYINNDRFEPMNYLETTEDCDTNFHDAIEDEYFGYFSLPSPPYLFYNEFTGSDGLSHLILSRGAPGFQLEFIRSELSVNAVKEVNFTIHPNPVSETLFITSEKNTIESISIYSITGQHLLNTKVESNSVDVSHLADGLYFMEVTSAKGKRIQQFIKQ
jgi:hypothetical protein